MKQSTRLLQLSMEKLSTGSRINRASDDAAGLSISERLIGQMRGIEQGIRNTQDGYSMLSVAEGAASSINDNLQRIRELTVQAGNDTMGTSERTAISSEINQRLTDISRISTSTTFNGIHLLDNAIPATMNLQVGPNGTDFINVKSALTNAGPTALGLPAPGTLSLSTGTAARTFLTTLDTAISTMNTKRSTIGAMENRLDSIIDSSTMASMNVAAANSRIRDTDVAHETAIYVRNQLLQQSNISLMSQMNAQHSSSIYTLFSNLGK
jgi:flagellin